MTTIRAILGHLTITDVLSQLNWVECQRVTEKASRLSALFQQAPPNRAGRFHGMLWPLTSFRILVSQVP